MNWIIVLCASFFIFMFIYNGFRTRCPKCGEWSLNTQTTENKEHEQNTNPEIRALQKALFESSKSNPETAVFAKKPNGNFANKVLTCKYCQHEFDRQSAMIWLKIANKFGEEKAIEEYEKVKNAS